MENQVFNWFLKKGNIIIQKNEDLINLQLNFENSSSCLLAPNDANEIVEILTNMSSQIWENPDYVKKTYTNHLYNINGEQYFWEINNAQLLLKYNETENAIEIKSVGSRFFNIEINYIVEIIQVLEFLNKS